MYIIVILTTFNFVSFTRWNVFRARLFRESCVYHKGNYVKDLNKLGRDLQKIVIVDNSPASYIFHPDNAVSRIFSIIITFHLRSESAQTQIHPYCVYNPLIIYP